MQRTSAHVGLHAVLIGASLHLGCRPDCLVLPLKHIVRNMLCSFNIWLNVATSCSRPHCPCMLFDLGINKKPEAALPPLLFSYPPVILCQVRHSSFKIQFSLIAILNCNKFICFWICWSDPQKKTNKSPQGCF